MQRREGAAHDAPLVSSDFNDEARSCILDADQTRVLEKTFGRVLAWYDNTWGYSNHMLDVAALMARQSESVSRKT